MRYDVVVVGAGLAGAAAARALAELGRSVLLLEQFTAGHAHGSSHGSARIVRRAYADPLYVRLTGRAFELWRETERAAGVPLLRMLGGLDLGRGRDVPGVAALLAEQGVPHEVLPAAEAEARWPGMRLDGDVLFHPQAGTLDAGAAVAALVDLAVAAGAEVRWSTAAARVQPSGVVELADGDEVTGSTVVVAAGAWVEQLLGEAVGLPALRVTQEDVFHFPRRDPTAPAWPSVISDDGQDAPVYHLAGGRDGGPGDDRKVGVHRGGVPCTAATRTGSVDPGSLARVVAHVERELPGLVPEPTSSTTCLYTTTPSEDFVLDRVGPVVVCSPCSGHGAKFAPLVGELVAGLVTGAGAEVPDRFRLAAHRRGRTGTVSL